MHCLSCFRLCILCIHCIHSIHRHRRSRGRRHSLHRYSRTVVLGPSILSSFPLILELALLIRFGDRLATHFLVHHHRQIVVEVHCVQSIGDSMRYSMGYTVGYTMGHTMGWWLCSDRSLRFMNAMYSLRVLPSMYSLW